MGNFQNFIKSLGGAIRAKSYVGILSGGLPVSSKKWGAEAYLKAFEISLYTNRAISKRSEKVGQIQFKLKDKAGKEIENDPLMDLLKKPNKHFSGQQFWTLAQKYFDLVGEVYILVESEAKIYDAKKISGLHLLLPTKVKPIFDKETGEIVEYEYKTADRTNKYTPEQILYIHNPNPTNPLRGMSLLTSGVMAIQTETEISSYHSKVLANGGKVEGVFKFKTGPLTEEQLDTVKARYQKEYGAAKKSGLPLFLGGDAEYIRTGLNMNELGMLEAKKMTLEDICILTSVPKSILASTNDAKFDNADADVNIFLRETIEPLQNMWSNALDTLLFPGDKILTHVDPTPENVDRTLKVIENGVKNYYITTNEAREMRGLDPIEGGDEILIPFNLTTLDGAQPTEESKALKKKLKK